MSNVLSELLKEKQEWIEHHKCGPSIWSRIINIVIVVAIGLAVVKVIENPNIVLDIVNLFA